MQDRFRHAMVLYANYATFSPGRAGGSDCVESRMLLWCRQGRGLVRVNGTAFDFEPGQFLILPWHHAVHYRAAQRHPFVLAGVHLVPSLTAGEHLVFRVRHDPSQPLADSSRRADVPLPGFERVRAGHFAQWPALEHLGEYIVQWFMRGPTREVAWDLARQLIREWLAWDRSGRPAALPAPLRRVLQFLDDNLGEPLEIEDLARAAGRSAPTLFRLFRQHLGTTPKLWLQKQRLRRAAELLQTTLLPISEVSRRVGLEDPRYFARLFRQAHGLTASAYRRRSALL